MSLSLQVKETVSLHADSPLPTSVAVAGTPLNRKRKLDAADGPGSSPPPSDRPQDESTVLSARSALTRPRLTVSRGPVFVPVADGADWYLPEQIAQNRLGFRYYHAGLSPPGSTLPYRTIESRPEGYVRISWEDRSAVMRVTQDGLGLQGEKGFRGARLNVPVREGSWYMEIKVERAGGERVDARDQGAYVRLGWARREAPLQAPAGLDGYSYGYRDKTGEKVTLSRLRPYGVSYGSGDVVGMYISLPPLRMADANDPNDPAHLKRERIPIDYKGQEYFETREYPQTKEMAALMEAPDKHVNSTSMPPTKKTASVKNVSDRGRGGKNPGEPAPLRPLPTLSGSQIAFFVNGQPQGTAFEDIYDFLPLPAVGPARKARERDRVRHKDNMFDDGWLGYYPFVSLFNSAQVRLNPGPDFDFPPAPDFGATDRRVTWRPMSERYSEFMREQWALDEREEEEAKAANMRKDEERLEEALKTAKAQQKVKRRERPGVQTKMDVDSPSSGKGARKSGVQKDGSLPQSHSRSTPKDESGTPAPICAWEPAGSSALQWPERSVSATRLAKEDSVGLGMIEENGDNIKTESDTLDYQ